MHTFNMAFHLMTKIPAVLCLMSIIFAVTEGSPSHIFEEHPGTPSMPIEENLPKSEINTDGDAVRYLEQFGYVGEESEDPRTSNIRHAGALEAALKNFQRMAGIPQTGILDGATKTMMSLPRCGVKDADKSKRMKRYTLNGSKWDQRRLTYKINSFTNDLDKERTKEIFAKAFDAWAQVSGLTFQKRESGNADIDIEFATREHGDGNAFDGPGRTLAHAFFPVYGGDAHFDDDETFTDGQHRGANLFQVAAHEFGHSLGLSHSENKDALMAPFYRGYVPNYRLHSDDIAAIQALYGPKVAVTQKPPVDKTTTPKQGGEATTRPTRGPPVGDCSSRFDAVASAKSSFGLSFTIAFSGNKYYIIAGGKPKAQNIKDLFTQIDRVDAAIATSRGSTIYLYLFKDANLYKYTLTQTSQWNSNFQLKFIGQSPISTVIRGLPDHIDAIFSWGRNDNIYAFKGKQYWRVSGTSIVDGYPRPISNWRLPGSVNKVDAVVKYNNGRTYFFVDEVYYRYNDGRLGVDSGYPRKIGEAWLECTMGSIQSEEDTANLVPEAQGSEMADEDDTFTRVKTTLQLEEEGTSGARPLSLSRVLTSALSVFAVVIIQRFV